MKPAISDLPQNRGYTINGWKSSVHVKGWYSWESDWHCEDEEWGPQCDHKEAGLCAFKSSDLFVVGRRMWPGPFKICMYKMLFNNWVALYYNSFLHQTSTNQKYKIYMYTKYIILCIHLIILFIHDWNKKVYEFELWPDFWGN